MKKILLSLIVLGLSLNLSATIIDFESATIGTTANVVLNTGNSGAGGVFANPVTNGINTSAQALHIVNAAYGNLNFPDLVLPAGSPATYGYTKFRCKILIMSGTDVNWPQLYFRSATNSTEQGTTIGQYSPWGTASVGTWVQCEYVIANSALATIPAGQLSIKLEKNNCEYAIDDVEMVPAAAPILSAFDQTFENYAIGSMGDAVLNTGNSGAGGVFANPATTGIDASAQALHIVNAAYGNINFPTITLPAGTPSAYAFTKVSCKILVMGGTDTDYPQLYFCSATNNTERGTIIGQYQPWGGASIGTWIYCEYVFANSTLATIPAGQLAIKLEKNNCEYAIDDVQLYSVSTDLKQTKENAINAFYNNNNQIQLSQVVNQAQVFDVNGRLLVTTKNTSTLNISNLGRGIYIVKTQLNDQNFVSKITK